MAAGRLVVARRARVVGDLVTFNILRTAMGVLKTRRDVDVC